MSKAYKVLLTIVSIFILIFAYWYYFTKGGQTFRYNRQVEKTWNKPALWEVEKKKEAEYKKEVITEKDVADNVTSLRSSGRQPIMLEGKRNYVTGKNVTFVVPSDMRRLKLNIQAKNGKLISSYTLPNSFIHISPNQRINLAVE